MTEVKDDYEFIEWIGENMVKLHGGWVTKYGPQIAPPIYKTEELRAIYNTAKALDCKKTVEP